MRITIAAVTAVLAAAGAAHAEAVVPAATNPGQGVMAYPAAFFAEARPNNAFEMIQRLPGFTFDGGASVRGFADAAGNVLIDGERPTAKQDNLESVLRRVPASQVERIDLIRGGAPGVDMQGRTVMANVVRKKGSGVTGLAAASNNVYADGRQSPAVRLEATRSWDGKSLEGSLLVARYYDNGTGKGPRSRVAADGTELISSRVDATAGGYQANATAGFSTPFAGGKLKLNGTLFDDRYSDDEHDRLYTPAGRQDLYDRQNQERGELGAHYTRSFGERTTLEALAIEQVRHKTFSERFTTSDGEDDLFTETDTLSESIARAALKFRANDRLSLEGALEGAFNVQDSDSRYAESGVDIPLPAAKVRISEKRAEASGSATWRPLDQLTVEAGLRVEVSTIASSGDVTQSKTLTYPKPRLVATWSPDPDDQLRLRVEREVGQLNFGDFVASSSLAAGGVHAGNVDLVPQQAWVAEAAYERRFWKTGAAVITLRHSEIQDLADRAPLCSDLNLAWTAPTCPGVFDAPGNIGKGTEDDLIASLTLPLDRLGVKNGLLKGVYTWRRSEVTDPTTGQTRSISGQHPVDGEVHFSQDLPKLKSTWGVDVFQSWRERYYRFSEIDTYRLGTWVGLFWEYKPSARWSFRGELDNLGARPYQTVRDVYTGPRGLAPQQFLDHRTQNVRPILYFRVRRMFG